MTNLIPEALQRIIDARHHDPFEVLGRHVSGDNCRIRVFMPLAETVSLANSQTPFRRVKGTDFFELERPTDEIGEHYLLEWQDKSGQINKTHDPYCFAPQLPEFDIHLFSEGKHRHAYRFFGSHLHEAEGIKGILFAVWAPNAARVSVVGNFNQWDGRVHPMRSRGGSGVWELFIPELETGNFYKFEIRTRAGDVSLRTDPYGNLFQCRPETAAIVVSNSNYAWSDDAWINGRVNANWQQEPMSVYEVHLGSWRRDEKGEFLNYRDLAHQLCAHVKTIGFTHIELLPITEHPLDGSWGYQTTGYFAPTSRFGTPDDFRYFIDHFHQNGIGVLLDWVPAHFPRDRHALAHFDGSALYEHEDPRKGEHRDWGTLIFNFGRNEVRNFLISSAIYWLEEFHIDGLRVDAVASMLYLDYSREAGDWVPNQYGGRENLEAVDFLRELNSVTHDIHPGTLMVAEESTAWPQVSRPTWLGGLGFSMKWNMGWMHDTLSYTSQDPIYRHYHHDLLTFGLLYAFTENFVLPFSHDEVVHGKGSMIDKMPGDDWQKFANLRLLYTYMFTYPGKKLLFMGAEFAQGREWNEGEALDWFLQDHPYHQGITTLLTDLNRLYKAIPALHQVEFEYPGFDWIDCHDSSQSILSYLRKDRDGNELLTILNFTPVPREDYRIGVNYPGVYREIMNSDSEFYGGSNMGNGNALVSDETPWMGRDQSIILTIPPLGAILLQKEQG
ncbi:MAG: 1,4-alpha-glucan branching protein GlgB [Candidatus Thiodiazotropha sp. (ex Codakia rugifera)]|nr:1,4-alpha-glucan branching protein GlgB [Candidatus Thiodiazotropha sp. (ex Codakia rugifera)]